MNKKELQNELISGIIEYIKSRVYIVNYPDDNFSEITIIQHMMENYNCILVLLGRGLNAINRFD